MSLHHKHHLRFLVEKLILGRRSSTGHHQRAAVSTLTNHHPHQRPDLPYTQRQRSWSSHQYQQPNNWERRPLPTTFSKTFSTFEEDEVSDEVFDEGFDKVLEEDFDGWTPPPIPKVPKVAKTKISKVPKKLKSHSPPWHLLQLSALHTRDTLEEAFDRIAPRTELKNINGFLKLRDKLVAAKIRSSQVATGGFIPKKKPVTFWTIADVFWRDRISAPIVKHLFWSMIIDSTQTTGNSYSDLPSDTVAAEDVAILEQAREAAVKKPLLWDRKHKMQLVPTSDSPSSSNNNGKRKMYVQKSALRSERLCKIHSKKSTMEKTEEARQFAQILRSNLPPSSYKMILEKLKIYVQQESQQSEQKLGNSSKAGGAKKLTFFLSTLHKKDSATHFHFIAPALVDFFYMNTVYMDGDKGDDSAAAETGNICEDSSWAVGDIFSFDKTVSARQQTWNEARENFVSAFQSIQAILLEENEQRMLEGYKEVGQDESENSIMNYFEKVIKAPPEKVLPKKNMILDRKYVAFDVISVGDLSAYQQGPHPDQSTRDLEITKQEDSEAVAVIEASLTNKVVFVDNLPIDVTENALMTAYSRCGPIESIQIYHQRLDLDPGRKPSDSKKKIKKPSLRRRAWTRSRTPLYATILFRDAAAAQKASSDPLRIFGMVLDKHLMQSYGAPDMTKLYLEDMPRELDDSSIEYELSQILAPRLYVSLNIEREHKKRKNEMSNCKINFPDFDSAYWAYSKLSNDFGLLKDGKCALHWFPTPNNAHLYWTRKLNF